jgi:hypothetical protein
MRSWPLQPASSIALEGGLVGLALKLFGPGIDITNAMRWLLPSKSGQSSKSSTCLETAVHVCAGLLMINTGLFPGRSRCETLLLDYAGLPHRGTPLLLPVDVHINISAMPGQNVVRVDGPFMLMQLSLPAMAALKEFSQSFASAKVSSSVQQKRFMLV